MKRYPRSSATSNAPAPNELDIASRPNHRRVAGEITTTSGFSCWDMLSPSNKELEGSSGKADRSSNSASPDVFKSGIRAYNAYEKMATLAIVLMKPPTISSVHKNRAHASLVRGD